MSVEVLKHKERQHTTSDQTLNNIECSRTRSVH